MNTMLVGLPVLRNAVRQIETTEDALAVARQNARMALAFIIREELTRTGETQTEFAKRFGVSKAHVTDCLYNRRYSPALAEALLKSHTADAAGEGDA